jgi:hypothetical protein
MKLVRIVFSVAAITAAAFALETAPCVAASTLSNTAVISNPGNGNFAGFEIVVDSTGKAWAIDGAGRSSGQLPLGVAQAFFAASGTAMFGAGPGEQRHHAELERPTLAGSQLRS